MGAIAAVAAGAALAAGGAALSAGGKSTDFKDTRAQASKDLEVASAERLHSFIEINNPAVQGGFLKSEELAGAGGFTANLGAKEWEALDLVYGATRPEAGGQAGAFADTVLNETLAGNYLSPDSNPYIQDLINTSQRGTLEAFEEATVGNRIEFNRSGQRLPESSAFGEVQRRGERDLANTLADIETEVLYDNYVAERENQLKAVDRQRQDVQDQIQNELVNLEAQGLPRLIEQYGIDAALVEFQSRRKSLLEAQAIATGLAAPSGAFITSQSDINAIGGAALSAGGAGLISGAGAFA